jgi:hypothetical protein
VTPDRISRLATAALSYLFRSPAPTGATTRSLGVARPICTQISISS